MQQTQLGHGQPEVLLLLPRLAWAEHTQICLQPQGSSQGLSSGHQVLLLKQVGCISMGVRQYISLPTSKGNYKLFKLFCSSLSPPRWQLLLQGRTLCMQVVSGSTQPGGTSVGAAGCW